MPIEVACPGCKATLKAPDAMAGKKARCKGCNTSFALPGPAPDSVGESQMLSAIDAPVVKPPKAAPAPVPAGDPFAFDAPAAEEPRPAKAASRPKMAPVPPPAPVKAATPKRAPVPAAGDPFAFGGDPEPGPDDEPDPTPLPPPKAKAKPAPAAKKARPPEPEPTPDEDDAPAPARGGDPFAFSGGHAPVAAPTKSSHKEKGLPPAKAPARGRKGAAAAAEPADDGDRPAYRGAEAEKGAGKKTLLFAGGLGVVAILLVVVAVVVVTNKKKKDEAVAAAKKEVEDKAKAEAAATAAATQKALEEEQAAEEAKKKAKQQAKKGGTPPAGKPDDGKAPPAAPPGAPGVAKVPAAADPTGPPIPLPKGVPFTFAPKPLAKVAPGGKPGTRVPVEAAAKNVLKVFPPDADQERVAVVFRTGGSGKNEKLAFERYFAGVSDSKIEFDGDGRAGPRLYDLSPDATRFAALVDGKLTVWDVADKEKKGEPWDLFASDPSLAPHKAAGAAALYFGAKGPLVATVTPAGAVHVWDYEARKMVGEWVPKGPAFKVVDGAGVAVDPGRGTVGVVAGGTLFRIAIGAGAAVRGELDLGGVVKPLALGIGDAEARVVLVGETLGAKSERVVLRYKGGEKVPAVARWPAAAGEPAAAGWASSVVAVVTTADGKSVAFDDEGVGLVANRPFGPVGAFSVDKGADVQQVPSRTKNSLWVLAADPADPAKAILAGLEMPFEGYADLQAVDVKQPVSMVLLVVK